MKITYTPNPLNTIVELDEHEIELFRLKLKHCNERHWWYTATARWHWWRRWFDYWRRPHSPRRSWHWLWWRNHLQHGPNHDGH